MSTHKPRSLAELDALIPPTFKRSVDLPVPGGTHEVEFEFRTRNLPELQAFTKKLGQGMTDAKAIAEVAVGWSLDDKFTAANIGRLLKVAPGGGHAIVQAYMRASTGAWV